MHDYENICGLGKDDKQWGDWSARLLRTSRDILNNENRNGIYVLLGDKIGLLWCLGYEVLMASVCLFTEQTTYM